MYILIARQSRGPATALWAWTWRSKSLSTWYENALQFHGEPRKGGKKKQKGTRGNEREPKGSQMGTKGVPKGDQNGAKIVPNWKRHLQKHPLRNRNEKVGKKDAERMTIYAKKVNQCTKSLKINEKSKRRTNSRKSWKMMTKQCPNETRNQNWVNLFKKR